MASYHGLARSSHHFRHVPENSIPNPLGKCRADRQRSSNGEKMLSSRSEEEQASTAHTVLCKIYDGKCGNHAEGRLLVQKALSIGNFWPTIGHYFTEYVKRCDRCQHYKLVPSSPAKVYHPQNSSWPFMQLAIDLVSPMPLAPAKKDMIIVATDYLTKWIKVKVLSSTKEVGMEQFIWKNIICRFGCQQSLVTENGS
ncbi:hypothetical protein L3X38_036893 [Prunus dulcis]|uniref:Integrase catalytic domain-containing protein n=1 Tax=Prunus dulcis TaxID=3755 RepID=A0AAD4V3K0_PRUDU|nr:hypothetical protein L3X38_036893 [Prunus dulcis]